MVVLVSHFSLWLASTPDAAHAQILILSSDNRIVIDTWGKQTHDYTEKTDLFVPDFLV